MRTTRPSRTTKVLPIVALLALAGAALAGLLGDGRPAQLWEQYAPGDEQPDVSSDETWGSPPEVAEDAEDPDPLAAGAAVDAGGVVPGLQSALEDARFLAATVGVELPISSAYRSASEQLALLEDEIEQRGSVEEALRWVFPPDRSMHVRGLAVDINGGPGADWLDQHGAQFGLCRTLDWEWWHFEWRQRWQDEGRCPAPATTPEDAPPP